MFARKKEVIPLTQTYPKVAEELHFGITTSVKDQVISTPFRNAMAIYIDHRMTIERCEQALENADLSPGDKVQYIQRFAQENKISSEIHTKVTQQLEKSRTEVQTLSEPVFEQVAADLALLANETDKEVAAVEVSVSDQLLADTAIKDVAKQQRQQQKEQEKTVKTHAKEFYKIQEESAKTLEKDIDVESIARKTTQLDSIATELEQQAKPVEEVKTIPKQVPEDYKRGIMGKQLNKQLREPTPDLGFDDISL